MAQCFFSDSFTAFAAIKHKCLKPRFETLISAHSEKPSAERKGRAAPVRLAPYGVYAVFLVAQGLADFVYKTVNIFVNYLAPCQYWREPNCLQCDGVEVIKGGGFLKS